MKRVLKSFFSLVLFSILIMGCGGKPKVISGGAENNAAGGSTGIFSDGGTMNSPNQSPIPSMSPDLHNVVVEDALNTTKYVYLNVKENGKKFWIATLKQEVEIGGSYFYRGGLLKTKFESKEHNRTFDTIYLVSNITPANHGNTETISDGGNIPTETDKKTGPRKIDVEGSVKISEIVANPQKYAGKTIQISGECTKINPNIMGVNWIHLKDGSRDDYDLVITSDVAVPEGHVVTMTGTVALDKDFGAGYRYEIILEGGKMVR